MPRHRLILLLLPLLLAGCVLHEREVVTTAPASSAEPGVPATNGCYVQIFDDEDLDESDPHTTIQGPASFPDLANLNGKNWGGQIESLIVGPGAKVRAYKGEDFTQAAMDFQPGQRVERLGPYDFEDKISSLQVSCVTPSDDDDDDDDDDEDIDIEIERR